MTEDKEMEKHPIDLFIEIETKLLREIQEYLDCLAEGNFEHFSVTKFDRDNYNFGFELTDVIKLKSADLHSISILLNVIEIYEKASKMNYHSLEEVIEQYIREQIVEEIKYICNNAEDDILDEEEEKKIFGPWIYN